MNPLILFTWLTKLGAVVKLGKVLWNISTIYQFTKSLGAIFSAVLKEHRIPKNAEGVAFLRVSAKLMRSEIIDFPNVNEQDIADKLEEYAIDLEAA